MHLASTVRTVRAVRDSDFGNWLPLWDGYHAFHGRRGACALDPQITRATWQRFMDPGEPVFALVAEDERGAIAGLAHYLFHRSTMRIEPTCHLQDLFTRPELRGRGVARALIEAVVSQAARSGVKRVYWQNHPANTVARLVYIKVARQYGFIAHELEA